MLNYIFGLISLLKKTCFIITNIIIYTSTLRCCFWIFMIIIVQLRTFLKWLFLLLSLFMWLRIIIRFVLKLCIIICLLCVKLLNFLKIGFSLGKPILIVKSIYIIINILRNLILKLLQVLHLLLWGLILICS